MNSTAIILSCYDKVDDLLAHLDILRFCPYPAKVIVVYMHEDDPPELPPEVDLIRLPSPGFTSGPLVSLTRGLQHADHLGMKWVVFRNADDWLFRHELTKEWIEHMEANDLLAAGYSWFSVGQFYDITLNENILSVPHFMASVHEAEEYFLTSDQMYNCEYKMAWWVRKALSDPEKQFFRLPDREQEPGIGWEPGALPDWYKERNREMPEWLREQLRYNHRFFCHNWQMIGCHDNVSRLFHYGQVRKAIPYYHQLEKCTHFSRWLQAAQHKGHWNKPTKNYSRLTRLMRPKPIRTEKMLPRRVFFL